jgi:hypothetical protein
MEMPSIQEVEDNSKFPLPNLMVIKEQDKLINLLPTNKESCFNIFDVKLYAEF